MQGVPSIKGQVKWEGVWFLTFEAVGQERSVYTVQAGMRQAMALKHPEWMWVFALILGLGESQALYPEKPVHKNAFELRNGIPESFDFVWNYL